MPSGLTSPVHLAVILLVALVVLGPEQLPGALRQVGRFIAEARRWSEHLRNQMEEALSVDDASVSSPPASDPALTHPGESEPLADTGGAATAPMASGPG